LAAPTGSGPAILEVYPGATLAAVCGARPSIRAEGYKKDASVRRELLEALVTEFQLDLCGQAEVVLGAGPRCDAFDALIAAVTAAIYTGEVTGWSICRPAPGLDPGTLCQEGWIYFPIPGRASPSVGPDPSTADSSVSRGEAEHVSVSRKSLEVPPAAPELAPAVAPVLDPEGLSAADVVNRRIRCPACRDHVFQRWPSGWDAHSHRCPGLAASSHADRKAEFKARYRHLFR
jgi:hypothetical protein